MMAAAKRKTTYEEDIAVHQIKRAKTKADLEAIILRQARVVGEQARELRQRQGACEDAEKHLDDLRDLDRAVATLARYRLFRDRMLPQHPEEAVPYQAASRRCQNCDCDHGGSLFSANRGRCSCVGARGGLHAYALTRERKPSRVRANTYPQALADVLAELLASAADIGAAVEEAAASDEDVAEAEMDRERMLRALGVDEWEWEHRLKWRY